MKALTVQQPWAWAIIHGGKSVENRSQAWSYRGPLAIHAGLTERGAGWVDERFTSQLRQLEGETKSLEELRDLLRDAVTFGAIIGVVDLVDVHPAQGECCSSPWGESPQERLGKLVHLMLEHPRPLRTPIPARGRLGLWDLDGEQLAELVGSGVLSGMECA